MSIQTERVILNLAMRKPKASFRFSRCKDTLFIWREGNEEWRINHF